jgi:hypothetical protein
MAAQRSGEGWAMAGIAADSAPTNASTAATLFSAMHPLSHIFVVAANVVGWAA